ncbi:hypothetical protein [Myxococcus xanthus]|uniref:hypothetical protein n=1 Tax=Myxococcus xanthus TaxID=34 RepID=UPI0020A3AA5A|nr:hypothetical protein [Myxococcus xanthus]
MRGHAPQAHLAARPCKTRREYEQLSEKLRRHFGDAFEQQPSVAGLHLCVTFTRGDARLERELARRGHDAGIGIEELSRYFAGTRTRHGWVPGYGCVTTDRINEGLRRPRARLACAL